MTRLRFAVLLAILLPVAAGAVTWPVGGDPYTTDTLRQVLGLPTDAPVQAFAGPRYFHQSVDVEATAEDGFIVRGRYAHTAVRTQAPVVVLVHDCFSSSAEFAGFDQFLLDAGVSTLAIDLRGHGRSTLYNDGRELLAASFERDSTTDVYTQMDRDVSAAIRWLKDSGRVDPQGIFLYGNAFGASALGKALPRHSNEIRGCILVSPQFTYRGIELVKELTSVQGVPLLVLAGQTSGGSSTILTRVSELNPNVIGRQVEARGVGRDLMGNEGLRRHVAQFIDEHGKPRP